jgi:hypothetical protein
MTDSLSPKPVERLYPFVLKARILLIGRDTLRRSKSKLHFVLITTDLSEGSRVEILKDFAHYPIVQKYTSAELDTFFGIKGAKVIGFAKSNLAQSIYAEMKESRINQPLVKPKPAGSPPTPPSAQKAS